MKRYMMVLLVLAGIYSMSKTASMPDTDAEGSGQAVAESKPVVRPIYQIAPTTAGEDAIVRAITYYSNLIPSDVNQYKFVRLGDLGTLSAFILGLFGAFEMGNVAAKAATNYPGAIKSALAMNVGGYTLPEGVQKVMQNPITLVGLGVVAGSAVSYKLLYPRTRAGVLQKVDRFIDVCRSLERADTYSIVQIKFNDVAYLKSYLPQGWQGSDIRIYNALDNLASQAQYASALLNGIKNANLNFSQNIEEINERIALVDKYGECLQWNRMLMYNLVQPELNERLRLANIKADTDIKVVGKWALYGGMAKGTVSSVWNGIKELYNHPEILAVLGLGWVTTKYFTAK